MHAIYYEETHICFFHGTQKAITIFPINLLGEGKTVSVPPVRFCIRFQWFTNPTVHRLFDFLWFDSTIPVRFQNLIDFYMYLFFMEKKNIYFILYILINFHYFLFIIIIMEIGN